MNVKEAQDFYKLWRSWIGDGLSPVALDKAQSRTDICLKCPMNKRKPLDEAIKGTVVGIVRRQILMRNALNLRVQGEEDLHICDVCQCVLGLLVWVPEKFIKETKTKELLESTPEFCWQREALK